MINIPRWYSLNPIGIKYMVYGGHYKYIRDSVLREKYYNRSGTKDEFLTEWFSRSECFYTRKFAWVICGRWNVYKSKEKTIEDRNWIELFSHPESAVLLYIAELISATMVSNL